MRSAIIGIYMLDFSLIFLYTRHSTIPITYIALANVFMAKLCISSQRSKIMVDKPFDLSEQVSYSFISSACIAK